MRSLQAPWWFVYAQLGLYLQLTFHDVSIILPLCLDPEHILESFGAVTAAGINCLVRNNLQNSQALTCTPVLGTCGQTSSPIPLSVAECTSPTRTIFSHTP